MNKLYYILAAVPFIFSSKKAVAAKKSTNRLLLPQITKSKGYCSLSDLTAAAGQKGLTPEEEAEIKKVLRTLAEKYGSAAARNFERILRSETGHFKSLLFRTTKNYGAILYTRSWPGKHICLYVRNVGGRNLINDRPKGQKYCYRFYDSSHEALNDLIRLYLLKKGDLLAYAGINETKDPARAKAFLRYYASITPRFCNKMNVQQQAPTAYDEVKKTFSGAGKSATSLAEAFTEAVKKGVTKSM